METKQSFQTNPDQTPLDTQQLLNLVTESLNRVPRKTNVMIYQMCQKLSEMEIIQIFNQQATDLFALLLSITIKLKKESEYKISNYKFMFETAIKGRAVLPLEKFTLNILAYADDIYSESEEKFLKMTVPDTNINIGGNEFGLMRSESFKRLWEEMNKTDKVTIRSGIILLTTYAHAHFFKTSMKYKQF